MGGGDPRGNDEVAESERRQCRVMVRGCLVIVLSEPQFPHLSSGDAIGCGEGWMSEGP